MDDCLFCRIVGYKVPAQVVFEVLADVPNHFIPVNPIGLQVTHIHVDESFE